jgi:hypothetical protein
MDSCYTCKGASDKGACPHCRKRLKKMLKEVVAFIDLLIAYPSLQQQTFTNQENRGSSAAPLIINVQIVDLISKTGVQAVLESWAELVIDVRLLSKDILLSTVEHNKLHTIANVLDTNNEWIADQDVWTDYYQELKHYWSTLRRIVYGERKPPAPVPCPVQDCTGTLILRSNGDVDCNKDDGHAWQYHEWSRLAKLVMSTNVQDTASAIQ